MQKSSVVVIVAAVVMVAGVYLALSFATNRTTGGSTSSLAYSQSDIEKIVKNYLMENPQVIFDAVRQMEVKENEKRLSQMREGAKTHAAELFNEAGSIVTGNPNGDVTIVEFFDYRCGYCRKIVPELSQLIKQDGNIRMVLKEFPILSKESEFAAKAAIAAHKQGKYWDFHLALMSSEELSPDAIMSMAKSVGLNTQKLAADMNSPSTQDVIVRNHKLAQQLGIEATPTFYIGDIAYSGAMPLSELKDAVAAARKAKRES
jgi:protein-disulfide isomerase